METLVKTLMGLLGVIVVGALVCVIMGLPLMILWNWLMPTIFGLTTITFWQAIGLNILATILFQSHTSSD
jgi:hypothetical protein